MEKTALEVEASPLPSALSLPQMPDLITELLAEASDPSPSVPDPTPEAHNSDPSPNPDGNLDLNPDPTSGAAASTPSEDHEPSEGNPPDPSARGFLDTGRSMLISEVLTAGVPSFRAPQSRPPTASTPLPLSQNPLSQGSEPAPEGSGPEGTGPEGTGPEGSGPEGSGPGPNGVGRRTPPRSLTPSQDRPAAGLSSSRLQAISRGEFRSPRQSSGATTEPAEPPGERAAAGRPTPGQGGRGDGAVGAAAGDVVSGGAGAGRRRGWGPAVHPFPAAGVRSFRDPRMKPDLRYGFGGRSLLRGGIRLWVWSFFKYYQESGNVTIDVKAWQNLSY